VLGVYERSATAWVLFWQYGLGDDSDQTKTERERLQHNIVYGRHLIPEVLRKDLAKNTKDIVSHWKAKLAFHFHAPKSRDGRDNINLCGHGPFHLANVVSTFLFNLYQATKIRVLTS
jgi:hypothetical protein